MTLAAPRPRLTETLNLGTTTEDVVFLHPRCLGTSGYFILWLSQDGLGGPVSLRRLLVPDT